MATHELNRDDYDTVYGYAALQSSATLIEWLRSLAMLDEYEPPHKLERIAAYADILRARNANQERADKRPSQYELDYGTCDRCGSSERMYDIYEEEAE